MSIPNPLEPYIHLVRQKAAETGGIITMPAEDFIKILTLVANLNPNNHITLSDLLSQPMVPRSETIFQDGDITIVRHQD